ncbi:MAG: (deoxy)nucleoside triphosphate pyrophosphohydrolase [Lachnospiraceae bacterium]|nr:(deoxy)nucleoside triphosphate pyrophosphohydrolase [Lachnospiraceae bacterium]
MSRTIRVAAAVIRDGDRIFAAQRGYGKYRGWWEFPGGKIEEGETPEQALVREIREELSAGIKVGGLIRTIEYDYPEFHLSMDCFWAELVPEDSEPDETVPAGEDRTEDVAGMRGGMILREAEAAKWLTAGELDSVKWLPADLEIIDAIREELQHR